MIGFVISTVGVLALWILDVQNSLDILVSSTIAIPPIVGGITTAILVNTQRYRSVLTLAVLATVTATTAMTIEAYMRVGSEGAIMDAIHIVIFFVFWTIYIAVPCLVAGVITARILNRRGAAHGIDVKN